MKFKVLSQCTSGSRTNIRGQWYVQLPVGAITCLAVVLTGCGQVAPASSTNTTTPTTTTPSVTTTHYTIQDLGVVGTPNQPGQPFVISTDGWVSGGSAVGTALHAVLSYGQQAFDIGAPGMGGSSIAFGVNNGAFAVGEAESTSGSLTTKEDFCGYQAMGYSKTPTPCVPFLWSQGKMTALKTLGGANGVANQINSANVIAGYAENTSIDPACPAPQTYQFKPVVWSAGNVQELPTGSDPNGLAFSINEAGQVVGGSGTCAPFNYNWLFHLAPAHALLWKDGVATDLGNLGGALNNMAHGINASGQVVGGSGLAGDQTSHAFLWTAAAKMQDLGTVNDAVNNDVYSYAIGINDAGDIVGISANADFTILRGFVRQNGKLVDLNSLVSGKTPLHLLTACSINSLGEIIGLAIDPSTGATHAYLASPTA
ncbi:hypothetical protein [Terriglobus roseus]|uniref:Probable extracellular repeat, HAF family n=1 Tax=Terriglobus roseus TaxID=392734 RepID=A0A1H4RBL9_9BACT|nr:hypothetical protein [Terriglobus roseus]SEC29243.1 probable extracellular repeat, HAF family [Terriglobus roseus]